METNNNNNNNGSGSAVTDLESSSANVLPTTPSQDSNLVITDGNNAPPKPKEYKAWYIELFLFPLMTLLDSVIYVVFVFTVLSQSSITRKPVDPDKWQTTLQGKFWLLGLAVSLFLIVYSFVYSYSIVPAVLNPSNLKVVTYAGMGALLTVLFISHCMALDYTYLRKDLGQVTRSNYPFRFDMYNLMPILLVPVEFFQLCSPLLIFVPIPILSTIMGLVQFDLMGPSVSDLPVDFFTITLWISIGICFLYALCLGAFIYMELQPDHWVAPIILAFFPGTLYLSIVSNLLGALGCVELNGQFVLMRNNNMVCMSDEHLWLLAPVFLALVFYSSTALFVGSYRGNKSGKRVAVRFLPRFLVLERTLKDVYAVSTAMITIPEVAISVALVVIFGLLIANHIMKPCTIFAVNLARMYIYLGALGTCVVTFLLVYNYELIVGVSIMVGWWGLCFIGYIVHMIVDSKMRSSGSKNKGLLRYESSMKLDSRRMTGVFPEGDLPKSSPPSAVNIDNNIEMR